MEVEVLAAEVSLVVATVADIGVVAGELTRLTRNREASLSLDQRLPVDCGYHQMEGRCYKRATLVEI